MTYFSSRQYTQYTVHIAKKQWIRLYLRKPGCRYFSGRHRTIVGSYAAWSIGSSDEFRSEKNRTTLAGRVIYIYIYKLYIYIYIYPGSPKTIKRMGFHQRPLF